MPFSSSSSINDHHITSVPSSLPNEIAGNSLILIAKTQTNEKEEKEEKEEKKEKGEKMEINKKRESESDSTSTNEGEITETENLMPAFIIGNENENGTESESTNGAESDEKSFLRAIDESEKHHKSCRVEQAVPSLFYNYSSSLSSIFPSTNTTTSSSSSSSSAISPATNTTNSDSSFSSIRNASSASSVDSSSDRDNSWMGKVLLEIMPGVCEMLYPNRSDANWWGQV